MAAIQTDQIFEDIVKTIREPLLVLDSDLKIISANRSFIDSFEVTREETLGNFIYDLGNKQWDIPKLRELLETILPQKTSFDNYEVEHDFATIGRRIMLLNARQIERGEGEELIILLAIEDITERVQSEILLRDSEERYRRLFETADDGILLLEKHELKIHHANPAIMAMLGYSNEELIGSDLKDIGFPDNIGTFNEVMQTLNEDDIIYYKDVPLQKKTGQVVDADIYMVDRASSVQCNIRNITERKRLEKELLRAQKLESLGLLAGGIAHDYNNLLAAIMGNLSMAQEEAEPHSTMVELLNEIEQASCKARDLTHQFLTLSQGGYPRKEPGYIESLLKEILKQVQVHEGIECTLSIQDDLWPVEYDSKQMHFALSNVIVNAAEAMPQGGTIALQAENLVTENQGKNAALSLRKGKYVRISIQDEGMGIPEEDTDKIFDPYFSTKERGVQKGMGLGLTTAYAVVQKHGGHIEVNSSIGVGTTVTIYLLAECAESPSEIGSALHGAGKAPGAQRDDVGVQSTIANQQSTIPRILVMDDEESLRTLAQRMLELLGYEVETVKDGVEAIETYKKHMDSGEPFDGVILDLTIKGGMGGAQAIKELIKIDPGVKAIVCSGYFNDPVLVNYEEHGFRGAMAKPYQKDDLERVLKEVLR